MKHFAILIGTAITCILAAILSVVISRVTTIDLFTFKLWFIIPVGAMCVGALGASGGLLGARLLHTVPNWFDAFAMTIFAGLTMALIYYVDYATYVLPDGRKASDLVDFWRFTDLSITTAHMRVGRGARDTGEVGNFGYWLVGAEFLGFCVSGLSVFLACRAMERCASCGAYLRKLRTKNSGSLSFDEAGKLLNAFKEGDAALVREVLAWNPGRPARFGKTDECAQISYQLQGCPKCLGEEIRATVKAFNGKDWKDVPALTTRRTLEVGVSMRDCFT